MRSIMVLITISILIATTAWSAEPCQTQRKDHDRAMVRAVAAHDELDNYESLAPLVPGQDDPKLQQLKDNYEAAQADLKRTSDALDKCRKIKSCKKWKGGWHCTVSGSYDECCLDKSNSP